MDSILEKSLENYFNKKVIFEKQNNNNSKKEFIGLFNEKENTIIWAWSQINETKVNTNTSKELLYYGLNKQIDKEKYNYESIFLKNMLINSRFKIKSGYDIIFILSIILYILKNKADWIRLVNLPIENVYAIQTLKNI